MPRRKRIGTTEPLRRLAERFDTLRREADRLLASESGASSGVARPRLRVAKPAPSGRTAKTIAQRARAASSLFDAGRDELLTSLESQLAKRVAPLLERLDMPRRSEVDELARRVAALERRLAALPNLSPAKKTAPRRRRT